MTSPLTRGQTSRRRSSRTKERGHRLTIRCAGRVWYFIRSENQMADSHYWQTGYGLGRALFVIRFWRGGKPAWFWRRYAMGWEDKPYRTMRTAMRAAVQAVKP